MRDTEKIKRELERKYKGEYEMVILSEHEDDEIELEKQKVKVRTKDGFKVESEPVEIDYNHYCRHCGEVIKRDKKREGWNRAVRIRKWRDYYHVRCAWEAISYECSECHQSFPIKKYRNYSFDRANEWSLKDLVKCREEHERKRRIQEEKRKDEEEHKREIEELGEKLFKACVCNVCKTTTAGRLEKVDDKMICLRCLRNKLIREDIKQQRHSKELEMDLIASIIEHDKNFKR